MVFCYVIYAIGLFYRAIFQSFFEESCATVAVDRGALLASMQGTKQGGGGANL